MFTGKTRYKRPFSMSQTLGHPGRIFPSDFQRKHKGQANCQRSILAQPARQRGRRLNPWQMSGKLWETPRNIIYPLVICYVFSDETIGKPQGIHRKMLVSWDFMGFTRPGNLLHSYCTWPLKVREFSQSQHGNVPQLCEPPEATNFWAYLYANWKVNLHLWGYIEKYS